MHPKHPVRVAVLVAALVGAVAVLGVADEFDEAGRVDCLHARGVHDRRGARSLGAQIESDHESNTQAAAYAQEIPSRDAVPCNAIENVHIRP